MSKAIQIRLDQKLKLAAEDTLEEMGLDIPTAIRIFLKKVVITKRIPFSLQSSNLTENGFTEEFEDSILESAKDKDFFGPFSTMQEMIDDVHKKLK